MLRPGYFQEKEKNADYWIEYFPFEKKFSKENKKYWSYPSNPLTIRHSTIRQVNSPKMLLQFWLKFGNLLNFPLFYNFFSKKIKSTQNIKISFFRVFWAFKASPTLAILGQLGVTMVIWILNVWISLVRQKFSTPIFWHFDSSEISDALNVRCDGSLLNFQNFTQNAIFKLEIWSYCLQVLHGGHEMSIKS